MSKFSLKLLVTIFLFFSNTYINIFSYIGSGIIPYCKKDGKTFVLFALDNNSKNKVWGDFGGEKIGDFSLEVSAAVYAHEGSMGAFSGTEHCPAIEYNYNLGVKFFIDNIKDTKVINFKDRTRENKIFFVEVNFVTHSYLMHCYCNNYQHVAENGREFVRRNNFIWVDVKDLLYKIRKNLIKKDNLRIDKNSVLNAYLSQELKTWQAINVLRGL